LIAKPTEQPTEKILVFPSTKQELAAIKEPGERFGDVVARLIKERKENDFVAHLLRVAREGDFVGLDSDEEYREIRDEVKKTAPRNRKASPSVRKRIA
jgi:predicted CopG family antitoxin